MPKKAGTTQWRKKRRKEYLEKDGEKKSQVGDTVCEKDYRGE